MFKKPFEITLRFIAMKKIIIFDELTIISYPLYLIYWLMGYDLYLFGGISGVLSKFDIPYTKLKVINFVNSDSDEYIENKIIDWVNNNFDILIGDSKILKKYSSFLPIHELELAYKKKLIVKLYQDTQKILSINKYFENEDSPRKLIYYSNITSIHSHLNQFDIYNLLGIKNKLFSPKWYKLIILVKEIIHRILLFITFIFKYLFYLKFILAPSSNFEIQSYLIALRAYPTDFAFHNKYRTIDFLIDGKKIKKENVLFCAEGPTENHIENFNKKGYNYVIINSQNMLTNISPKSKTQVKKFMYAVFSTQLIESLINYTWITEVSSEIFSSYILWTDFTDKYKVKHYIVYNDFGSSAIIRNAIFSRSGVETWYYDHSTHFAGLLTPENKDLYLSTHLSCLNYSHYVIWNEFCKNMLDSLPNSIKSYEKVGPIWSEIAFNISPDSNETSHIVSKHFIENNGTIPDKIIGVFDTTFGDSVPLSCEDITKFIQGIIELLDNFKKVGVVFRRKDLIGESNEKYPEMIAVYDALKKHPRCFLIDTHIGDTSEVIALSDFVISACFTSTTIESLGVGKKAIFFDATNKFRKTYCDRPKLVAHDVNELFILTN